mgnify:FL=1
MRRSSERPASSEIQKIPEEKKYFDSDFLSEITKK